MARSCFFSATPNPRARNLGPTPCRTPAPRESLKFFTRVSWIVARGYIGRPGNRHRSGFIVRFTLQRAPPQSFPPAGPATVFGRGPPLAGGPFVLLHIGSCGRVEEVAATCPRGFGGIG